MATQLMIPFGGTGTVSLNTSGSSLFTAGSQIQADPVNNALRSSSLISSVLADTLFTSGLTAETTNSPKSDIAAKFKHFDIHTITATIQFTTFIAKGCSICITIPTINHSNPFQNVAAIKSHIGNSVRRFPATGYAIAGNTYQGYPVFLEISSTVFAVRIIDLAGTSGPRSTDIDISEATISDSVISIY